MSRQRTIGILREVKNKWERRCPLTPSEVHYLVDKGVRVLIQPSDMRIFTDNEFRKVGAEVRDDISDANTILGVKEFPKEQLIPNKSYLIFSHVIKAQPYNMPFLDECLNRKVRLFDYECIRAPPKDGGHRLVAFGKFAGIAGFIDGMRGLGERLLSIGYSNPFMGIASSYMYPTLDHAKAALGDLAEYIRTKGIPEPLAPLRFVFTGTGNVSQGAQDMFNLLPHVWVNPHDLPSLPKDPHRLYGTIVNANHLVAPLHAEHHPFKKSHYYENPHLYRPVFHETIAPHTNVLVNGMYWDARFPRLLTNSQIKDIEKNVIDQKYRKFLMVADISCDIEGSVEFLKRPSTIDKPFYMYDPLSDTIRDSIDGPGVLMLGVDNLPAEFPRDASGHFAKGLRPFVEALASIDNSNSFDKLSDNLPIELFNACITSDGKLTPNFEYITKLRESKQREEQQAAKERARQKQEKEGKLLISTQDNEVHCNVLLEGHLFDTGFINSALDLLENEGKDFQILHWDISPNRPQRKQNLSRCVVRLVADNETKINDIIKSLETLTKVMPLANARIQKLAYRAAGSSSTSTTGGILVSSNSEPKKILVLGSGYVAGPLVEYLSRYSHQLTIASLSEEEAKNICANIPHASVLPLDVSNKSLVEEQIEAHECVVSLLPAWRHLSVAELCIKHSKHLITASYVSPQMRLLDAKAKEAGVALINEVGLDPGIDHMSAMKIIDHVKAEGGVMESFESMCGGLPAPEAADNPFAYKFSWNPMGMLIATQNNALYRSNGEEVRIEGKDLLRAAKPISITPAFALEHYPNRDSLSYGPLYGIEDAKTMYRGTLRYSGSAALFDGFAKLGMVQTADIPIPQPANWLNVLCRLLVTRPDQLNDAIQKKLSQAGVDPTVIPRVQDAVAWLGMNNENESLFRPSTMAANPVSSSLARSGSVMEWFCKLLEHKLTYAPHERDLVLLFHRFGIRWPNGKKEIKTSTLISYGGDGKLRPGGIGLGGSGGVGYSAMARTVGLPAAITTQLLLQGKIKERGVIIPVRSEIYNPVLNALAAEGISLTERTVHKDH